MKIAIVAKGESLVNILSADLKQYSKVLFLNESILFSLPIKQRVDCEMFCIDIEPVFRVLSLDFKPVLWIPEIPHAGERKSILSSDYFFQECDIEIKRYHLVIGEELKKSICPVAFAINSSLQACLSLMGSLGFKEIDVYGANGKTHPLMQYEKVVPRDSYENQWPFIEKIISFHSLVVKYL